MSPLHPLGEVLFSAHMIQHEILMLIAAPLLVLSRPLIYLLMGSPVRVAARARAMVQNTRHPKFLAVADGALCHRLADTRAGDLVVARARFLSGHAQKRSGPFREQPVFCCRRSCSGGLFSMRTAAGLMAAVFFTSSLRPFTPASWSHCSPLPRIFGIRPMRIPRKHGDCLRSKMSRLAVSIWMGPASLVYIAAGLVLFAAWMKESDALLERAVYRAK